MGERSTRGVTNTVEIPPNYVCLRSNTFRNNALCRKDPSRIQRAFGVRSRPRPRWALFDSASLSGSPEHDLELLIADLHREFVAGAHPPRNAVKSGEHARRMGQVVHHKGECISALLRAREEAVRG